MWMSRTFPGSYGIGLFYFAFSRLQNLGKVRIDWVLREGGLGAEQRVFEKDIE